MPGWGFLCGAVDASQCAASLDLRPRVVRIPNQHEFREIPKQEAALVIQKEAWFDGEPTIDDVLSDPIVQTVMRSDGLTYENATAAVTTALARLRRLPEEPPRAA